MIEHNQRVQLVEMIEEARKQGARLEACCKVVGIAIRTYQRWTAAPDEAVKEDGRPQAQRLEPRNKLSAEERQAVLEICHRPEFVSLPPTQIVPKLADQQEYVASESTFYRILRAEGEQNHRGRAKAPRQQGPPRSHTATRPCQIWSWDITWLPGPVRGLFFYLYLIIDLYSRKIVGWEVYEREDSELAAEVVQRAVWAEGCTGKLEVLHADNGSPQKGSALAGLLERLGVERSHSRPRVSNDNPYSEAIFRTCKYRPDYPYEGFQELGSSREWVQQFVKWYNEDHQHSSINYVTPVQRHEGKAHELLEKRKEVYEAARARHPERWAGRIRNFEPVGPVLLNPLKEKHAEPAPT
jgi:putative transposase